MIPQENVKKGHWSQKWQFLIHSCQKSPRKIKLILGSRSRSAAASSCTSWRSKQREGPWLWLLALGPCDLTPDYKKKLDCFCISASFCTHQQIQCLPYTDIYHGLNVSLAMVMGPLVSFGDIQLLRDCVRTDRNKHVSARAKVGHCRRQ